MVRPLSEIVAQLRAISANPAVSTMLIQTEDLLALCDAADPVPIELPPLVEAALKPHRGWKHQPFEYYAAHFLIGNKLTQGDLYGNILGLAHVLQKEYETGVEHGRRAIDDAVPR